MIADTLNGYPVLAWIQTGVQSTGPIGYVLVHRRSAVGTKEGDYITAFYRQGDKEWSHGHYYVSRDVAFTDLIDRAKRAYEYQPARPRS